MSEKVKRIGIDSAIRRRNRLGKFAVPCMVSDRWIQFAKESGGHFPEGEFISIEIMTDTSGKPRRLSQLVLTREDLLRVLGSVQTGVNE